MLLINSISDVATATSGALHHVFYVIYWKVASHCINGGRPRQQAWQTGFLVGWGALQDLPKPSLPLAPPTPLPHRWMEQEKEKGNEGKEHGTKNIISWI